MENQVKNLNEHCEKPFIAKDKTKWYIQFWYKDGDGLRKKYKKALELNSDEFLKKTKDGEIEINKTDRKALAQELVIGMIEKLKSQYFNPNTRKFEITDKAELPLIKFFDDYIDNNSKYEKSEGTKVTYRAHNNTLRTFLNLEDGKYKITIPLKAADHHFIGDFLTYIENKDSIAHRDNLLMYSRAVFNYCIEHLELMKINPTKKFGYINKFESEKNVALSLDGAKILLEAAKKLDFHFYLLLKLMFYTLRRPDELLKLKYENFDFDKTEQQLKFTDKIIKTNKTQYSSLPPELMQEIKENIPANVQPDWYFMGNIGKDENVKGKAPYIKLMFAPAKTPYHHFNQKFDTTRKRLKWENIGVTLYGMKHTGVKYLMEEHSWTNQQIRDYTGHATDKMLARYARSARRKVTPHPAEL